MLDTSLLISAIAIVFSVVAVILTAMTKGIELALGFRESEATSAKLKRIRENLQKEIEEEAKAFLNECQGKKEIDAEITKAILKISTNMIYTVLGHVLLEEMTNNAKRFLKRLSVTTLTTLLTISYFVVYTSLGLISEITLTFGMIYIVLALVLGYLTIVNARRYFDIRLAFQKLAEDPTCEKCGELIGELKGKGISSFEKFPSLSTL